MDDHLHPRSGLLSLLPFPRKSQARRDGTGKPGSHPALIAATHPRSPVAEAYRQLRTNIQFSSLDRSCRTILVTSAGLAEDKSTMVANLAVTIAQTGASVVLVDADLRRPSLHAVFGLEPTAGLTNLFLVGDRAPRLLLQPTGVPQLQFLPSGPLPPNPSELLGSARMEEVIERLKEEAQYVLFDAPPVVAVTDAAVLATRMEGVLLVVQAGHTKRDAAQKAKALLEKVNAPLLGVVLINAPYDASVHAYDTEARQP
ncbi:MAG: CpsD/CapB family tyrosine-protein kinase [Chloroflexi bacterium]|nr:CpsD/CapB family tyrosine-protein kinase [Chloroflexota bacterium]